jgi:hypothetical protein
VFLGMFACACGLVRMPHENVHGWVQGAQSLRRLGVGISEPLPTLAREIWECVHPREGRIVDQASSVLAETRAKRRENDDALRRTMDEWSRRLHAAGVSERALVRSPDKLSQSTSALFVVFSPSRVSSSPALFWSPIAQCLLPPPQHDISHILLLCSSSCLHCRKALRLAFFHLCVQGDLRRGGEPVGP